MKVYSKAHSRREVIEKLDALNLHQKIIWDQEIQNQLLKLQLTPTKKIALYFPLRREINIWPFIENLYLNYKYLYFPFFNQFYNNKSNERNLYFVKLSLKNLTELFRIAGLLNPLEYKLNNKLNFKSLLSLNEIIETLNFEKGNADIVFVPCLGLNSANYRLGYGSAYYDDYFLKRLNQKKIPNWKTISVLYKFQNNIQFKENRHDIQIDKIITI